MIAKFLCRKDLARLLEMTVRQVACQENNLGLAGCREDLNKRVVRYRSGAALVALRTRGLLPVDEHCDLVGRSGRQGAKRLAQPAAPGRAARRALIERTP
jgi:hypothetical protein